MLYEQAIEDVRRALAALVSGSIDRRTEAINHALLVIGQLQAALDLERGGDVAKALQRFYCVVRARLLEAQVRSSQQILSEQIELLLSLREAWVEVERAGDAPRGNLAVAASEGHTSGGAGWSI
jgi:flagellar protein FliS